jgi:hypothetical protein
MKKIKFILMVFALLFIKDYSFGQEKNENLQHKNEIDRNFIKLNLFAIAFKNFSNQYERVLNKTISVAVSIGVKPKTSMPFKNLIINKVGSDDPETLEQIENFRMSSFSITPEIRFYLSKKGYGSGFYIAPFYRYSNYKTNNLTINYTNSSDVESSVVLSGKFISNTGGILFGQQWYLGKHMCLDWWIFGPHYGKSYGYFKGVPTKPLTVADQNDLREELENLEIPLTNTRVSVSSSKATISLYGPWAGIRAGISLGIKF